jgi:unsaturated rhamnogalacturonyl hydrolase
MKKTASLYLIPLVLLTWVSLAAANNKTQIIVTRNYPMRLAGESVKIVVGWSELVAKAAFVSAGLSIHEGNFGQPATYRVLDGDFDGTPDQLVMDFTFNSDEPLYSFSVEPGPPLGVVKGSEQANPRLMVQCLYTTDQWLKLGKGPANWPDRIIESTMAFYPDPATLPLYAPGNYSYEYGFFMSGVLQRYEETKKEEYLRYVKKWADRFLDSHGMLNPRHYNIEEYRLDDILPGRVFLTLFKITANDKYKNAADQLKSQLAYQPRTSEGGYWHKQIYPNQMWLDGIYMADVFSMQYAATFNEPKYFNDAAKQIKLIWEHTYNPSKGLMYHGWDESYNKVWADPENGNSPEFWSRGIGWYAMAIADCSDYLPLDHPYRKEIGGMFKELVKSLRSYQDKKTGLWYQVTDKGEMKGNWIETSASAMFAYAMAKGDRKGFLDRSYGITAKQAFNSLVNEYVYFDDDGKMYMDQTVKIGTLNPKSSNGDYNYYIGAERRINDYKGLGALLYLSQEVD